MYAGVNLKKSALYRIFPAWPAAENKGFFAPDSVDNHRVNRYL
jgi:hypothetical protein